MSRENARAMVDRALAGWQVPLLDVQQAAEDTELMTFLYDSLDSVEAIMTLEDELLRNIEDEEAEQWKTIGDVVNFIMEKKYGQAPATSQSA